MLHDDGLSSVILTISDFKCGYDSEWNISNKVQHYTVWKRTLNMTVHAAAKCRA